MGDNFHKEDLFKVQMHGLTLSTYSAFIYIYVQGNKEISITKWVKVLANNLCSTYACIMQAYITKSAVKSQRVMS